MTYLATTPGLSYEKPQDAMKVLLRARHVAPIFGLRTPIAPEVEDHLVIEEVPDIFHAGHVHTVGVDRYKSTLIINSGTGRRRRVTRQIWELIRHRGLSRS